MAQNETTNDFATGQRVIFVVATEIGNVVKGPERCCGSDDMYLIQTRHDRPQWVHKSQMKAFP